jgi:caa(3)-type oxidase subunit IV
MGHSNSHDAAHDLNKHVKIYLLVFGALLFGTVLTVAMYSVHFESMATTIAVALFIAIVKAALVAGFFMHLISERKAIYAILVATVFFFAGMMYLTVWHRDEIPKGTVWWEGKHTPTEQQVRSIKH